MAKNEGQFIVIHQQGHHMSSISLIMPGISVQFVLSRVMQSKKTHMQETDRE